MDEAAPRGWRGRLTMGGESGEGRGREERSRSVDRSSTMGLDGHQGSDAVSERRKALREEREKGMRCFT